MAKSQDLKKVSGTRTRTGWGRRLGLTAAVLAVLLLGFWAGLGMFIHSDQFRLWLSQRVSRSLKAEGTFEPLHWSGATFRSSGFHAVGEPKSKFSSIQLDGISAHLNAWKLLAGQVVLDDVAVEKANLEFLPVKPAAQGLPGGQPRRPGGKFPFKIRFAVEAVKVPDLSLAFQSRRGPAGTVEHARLTAVNIGRDVWTLTADGGRIQGNFMPATQILRARATLGSHLLTLTVVDLAFQGGGTVAVHGNVQLDHPLDADLHGAFEAVDLDAWPTNGEKISGLASGTVNFSGGLNAVEAGSFQGDVKVRQVHYDLSRHLSALKSWARSGFSGSANLDTVQAHVDYKNHQLSMTDLQAASGDALRVTGMVDVAGDQLQGQLQLGVKPALLEWIPGALELVFPQAHDGYQWTPVQLSGTLQNPKEDLTKRLVGAMEDRLGKNVKNGLRDAVRSLRDLLKH
ncbi:MAG TPA: hypothetical protein VGD78_23590 [Chthoniobacterales bacterium]